jgi:hypothetical protein
MDWKTIIAAGEQRTVEFKSDRGPLPDRDLIDAVVCFWRGAAQPHLSPERGSLSRAGRARSVRPAARLRTSADGTDDSAIRGRPWEDRAS